MKDKELIEKAMDLAKQLDLARSTHYADTILRLVQRIEELTADFPAPKSIVWEPEMGEKYWYVDVDGTLDLTNRRDDCEAEVLLEHHNVYKTQGQAEKAAEYQRRYNMALQAVLNLEPEQVVDWKDMNQVKHVIDFDHNEGVYYTSVRCLVDNLYPVLTDEENVQPLLDYLNASVKGESDG